MEYTALNLVDCNEALGYCYDHDKTGGERGRVVGRYTAETQFEALRTFSKVPRNFKEIGLSCLSSSDYLKRGGGLDRATLIVPDALMTPNVSAFLQSSEARGGMHCVDWPLCH